MKTTALAQMAATSFCAGVRHKRYSVQLEIATKDISWNLKEDGNKKSSL